MDRRTFVARFAGGLLGVQLAARAQQPTTIPRIGFLRTSRPPQSYIDAFEEGLRDRGYVRGKTILINYRLGDGTLAEVSRLAGELVALKVDVIVAGGGIGTRAARNATNTIPIVMTAASDPVGTGLVASLSRPGGNITGTSIVGWDLFAKRLELLRQVLPQVSRVAVLINRHNPAPANAWNDALAVATKLGVTLQRVEVQSAGDFEETFAAMTAARVEALIVVQSNIFETPAYRIPQLATSNRLPVVYSVRASVDVGGLMSYGPSIAEL